MEKYCGLSERDFDTLKHLNALQSIYNGAKARGTHVLDDNSLKEVTIITNSFIDAMKIYASRLTLRVPSKYDAPLECKIVAEEMSKTAASQVSDDSDWKMPPVGEKLIFERQMLAVISLLCTDFPNVTQTLLFEKCEDSDTEDDKMDGENQMGTFVDMLTDVLDKIGHSVSKDKAHLSEVRVDKSKFMAALK